MGSEETHPTSSVREEIPATSAEETAAAEHLKTQTTTEEEPEIPQPEEPEIAIPEVVMLTLLCPSQRIHSQGSKNSGLMISSAST